jgi:Ser/Thr protein kinase RdoA (MazF antagonist)
MAQQVSKTPGKVLGEGRTAEIYAWGEGQVLKLYRVGWPASWVEHEAQVSNAVVATGLPVPDVGGTLELDGRYGILFERISGPSLLRQFSARPWTVAQSLHVFTDLHLAMSRQYVFGLPSQREGLALRIQAVPSVSEAIRAQALERLDQLPDGHALCHGNYHPDNVLMTRGGPVINDWGSASSGHPSPPLHGRNCS